MPISRILPIDDVTIVCWDVDDFPIPEGRRVSESFRGNISKALAGLGYRGNIKNALCYSCDDDNISMKEQNWANELIFTAETRFDKLMTILSQMISYARVHIDEPKPKEEEINFVVITKDDPDGGDKEFETTLETLVKLGCNVYLAVPDGLPLAEMPPLTMASRVWYWSDLCDGKGPIERIGGEHDGPWEKKKKNHVYFDYELSDYEFSDGDDTTSDYFPPDSSSVEDDEDEGILSDHDEEDDTMFLSQKS